MDVSTPAAEHTQPSKKPGQLPGLFRLILILALVMGATLRVTNVAPKHKAVSALEAAFALKTTGHTPQQVLADLAHGNLIDNAALQQFQVRGSHSQEPSSQPEAITGSATINPKTINSAAVNPATLGSAMTLRRLTSGLLSLLALPLVYRLTRSHFPRGLTAIIALSLLAVSPLQIAYAQEAQPTVLAFILLLLNQLCLTRLVQFWQQRKHLAERLSDQPAARRWFYFCFYGVAYLLSALGLATCLALFPHWLGWSGVLLLILSWMLHLLIALSIDRQFHQAVRQRNPQISQNALLMWGFFLTLAITLNGFHVMSFKGWLKGDANSNLAIAKQIQQSPAPVIADPVDDDEVLALLSLSHHLPASAQWRILPKEKRAEMARHLAPNRQTDPFYLYRPSADLLETLKQQKSALSPTVKPWLWHVDP